MILSSTLLFVLAISLSLALAQQQRSFSFTNITTDALSECESMHFQLTTLDGKSIPSDVVPPFYMFSFELGGIARSDFLGSDAQNLTWTVRHSQGTQLISFIQDAARNVSDYMFAEVISGNSVNRHSTQITSDIRVAADKTQVATCDDLTLAITGGVKPYTVSVLGLNFTNFTLGTENDEFKYLNQDTPGDSFIVAASDVNGQWAIGTNLISSVGSTDVSCPGKESSGIASGSGASSNKAPIIGGIVGGIILLLLAVSVAAYFYIKRRKDNRLSATNRKVGLLDYDDLSPYVLPPETDQQMVREFAATHSYVSPHPESTIVPPSETSETPMVQSQHPSRSATAFSGANISSQEGSIDYMTQESFSVGQNSRPVDVTPCGSLQAADSIIARSMTAKERMMAREEENGRVQRVVQHEDAEDLMDVPPVYKEREARPSGSSVA